ncbi:MAG: SOS response-associated peptidase [Actinomycetota bacterium]
MIGMCGRYALSATAGELVAEFGTELDSTEQPEWHRYNVAPTDLVPVVLGISPPVRQLRAMTWGFLPSWTKPAKSPRRFINAREETVFTSPTFRRAVLARRCLVPADGWYEWYSNPAGSARQPQRQPYFLTHADQQRLAFAGVYEFWRDETLPSADSASWTVSFSILTAAAAEGLAALHPRMPVTVPQDAQREWLDSDATSEADIRSVIQHSVSSTPDQLIARPVSRRVGNVRHDDVALLDPAPAEELAGSFNPITGELYP